MRSSFQHQVPSRDTYLLRHINLPFDEKVSRERSRAVPGVFHFSLVDKSDCTAFSGKMKRVATSFSSSKLAFHIHAPTLWHTIHRV